VAWAEGAKDSFRLGRTGTPTVIINGEPADLLAWLLGRADGARLTVAGGGTLPELPPWR
jgi:maleylpyruvate isomerase